MGIHLKRATLDDLEMLCSSRIVVLLAANGLDSDTDMSRVLIETREYYKKALADGSHVAYLASENGRFVASGGISFYQVMPTYHNPTGQKAYIMNMYTAPEHRRRGIALHILERLVDEARNRGVTSISLEATDMGRPLYERFGFVASESEMELPCVQGSDHD